MKTVHNLLENKGRKIFSIGPDATVYEALGIMGSKDIGALLVMEGERLIGIISERDYARKVVLEGKRSQETKVCEIMTTRVVCTIPERTVEDMMALMTEKRVRHIPVVIDDKVQGVISIGDVVKAVIDEKEFYIQQLEKYITTGG